jgi:nucleoside phosphorylase
MEAGGACLAARHFKVPVSMLRVVSDNADPAKADDKWRAIGMKTLAHLLKSIPYEVLRTSIRGQ